MGTHKKATPAITTPKDMSKTSVSPLPVEWANNGIEVSEWWIKMGTAPKDGNCHDRHYGPDELADDFKVELNGGTVFLFLQYKDTDGIWQCAQDVIEVECLAKGHSHSHDHHA